MAKQASIAAWCSGGAQDCKTAAQQGGGGRSMAHVCAYKAHFEEVLADMRDFGVAAERRWIEILHACSDALSTVVPAIARGRG